MIVGTRRIRTPRVRIPLVPVIMVVRAAASSGCRDEAGDGCPGRVRVDTVTGPGSRLVRRTYVDLLRVVSAGCRAS
jgi:hypothetical protein